MDKDVIGNKYLFFGTVEKKAWRENIKHPKSLDEMRQNIHDFISYQTTQMTMAGWFQKGMTPPVMESPPSWFKKKGMQFIK